MPASPWGIMATRAHYRRGHHSSAASPRHYYRCVRACSMRLCLQFIDFVYTISPWFLQFLHMKQRAPEAFLGLVCQFLRPRFIICWVWHTHQPAALHP